MPKELRTTPPLPLPRKIHILVPVALWFFVALPLFVWLIVSLDLHGGAPRGMQRGQWMYSLSRHCFNHDNCSVDALPHRVLWLALFAALWAVLLVPVIGAEKRGWIHWTKDWPQKDPTDK